MAILIRRLVIGYLSVENLCACVENSAANLGENSFRYVEKSRPTATPRVEKCSILLITVLLFVRFVDNYILVIIIF